MLVPNNDITFSFTGKERDSETGFGYFGARYMDHELMTMWLSVDPMADKYPSISPYAYCAWNPVKQVDPDGRDIWMIDNLGNVVDYIECDDYDCIHIVDGEGNILSSSNYYEPGTISELCLDGQSNTSFSVCGFDNAKEIFEFLAGQYTNSNGMPLEWAHGTIVEKSLLTRCGRDPLHLRQCGQSGRGAESTWGNFLRLHILQGAEQTLLHDVFSPRHSTNTA